MLPTECMSHRKLETQNQRISGSKGPSGLWHQQPWLWRTVPCSLQAALLRAVWTKPSFFSSPRPPPQPPPLRNLLWISQQWFTFIFPWKYPAQHRARHAVCRLTVGNRAPRFCSLNPKHSNPTTYPSWGRLCPTVCAGCVPGATRGPAQARGVDWPQVWRCGCRVHFFQQPLRWSWATVLPAWAWAAPLQDEGVVSKSFASFLLPRMSSVLQAPSQATWVQISDSSTGRVTVGKS